jgi:hypothetical protein
VEAGRFWRGISEDPDMPIPNKENKPAQVPGDAESPPLGEKDSVVAEGVKRTDKTEPVQGAQTKTGKNQ